VRHVLLKWLRRIQSMVIHPGFLPRDHDEPCNDSTCSCVQNGFFCTKPHSLFAGCHSATAGRSARAT
jgi:hypothetical protein